MLRVERASVEVFFFILIIFFISCFQEPISSPTPNFGFLHRVCYLGFLNLLGKIKEEKEEEERRGRRKDKQQQLEQIQQKQLAQHQALSNCYNNGK
ncbi:hypothetical protein CKAN_02639900 [Cinnamomum micranthum f. kanehirae]|uniref:Uncharacterized protein n=1 Tax=Cinnamomum micranthum f. kanehirae TaxID=337451 RepID=A0A3S3R8N0_9MAGN|nr:hypothetical protein CKAN_02639900 [Cinnamomum micranthum f. kanehirae]